MTGPNWAMARTEEELDTVATCGHGRRGSNERPRRIRGDCGMAASDDSLLGTGRTWHALG